MNTIELKQGKAISVTVVSISQSVSEFCNANENCYLPLGPALTDSSPHLLSSPTGSARSEDAGTRKEREKGAIRWRLAFDY